MKTTIFSFYSNKKNLTLNKVKFTEPTQDYNRPRTGLWLAKNKLWYNLVKNHFVENAFYKEQLKHLYKVKVDMTDIFLLTKKNYQDFFNLYKKKTNSNRINWKKFIKENPTCKGIYLTFDPDIYRYLNSALKNGIKIKALSEEDKNLSDKQFMRKYNMTSLPFSEFPEHDRYIIPWFISSICVWNKSAIVDFKLIDT